MRRSVLAGLAATALSFVACSEQSTDVTAPPAVQTPSADVVTGCPTSTTAAQILAIINQLVPAGTIRNNVTKLVNKLPTRLEDRIKTTIRNQIFPIQDAILRAYYAGLLVGGTSTGTFDNVISLIKALYCYVGLTPPTIPSPTVEADVVVGVVFPNSPTTTLVVPTEQAALTVPTGAAPSPTTIVITKLPNSPGPLRTSLNQYPFFYHFSGTTATGPVTFNLDVLAGICPEEDIAVPNANLRLAHNVFPFGFGDVEVLPRPEGSPPGVHCLDLPAGGGPFSSRHPGGVGRFDWVERLLLPAELQAASNVVETVGVGGTTKKFSEFGIVDPTVIDYGSGGYSFILIGSIPPSEGTPTYPGASWFSQSFTPGDAWSIGSAPFGQSGAGCSIFNAFPVVTSWPAAVSQGSPDPHTGSGLLLRKSFMTPTGFTGDVLINVAIDNDIQVYLDGTDVTNREGVVFTARTNTDPAVEGKWLDPSYNPPFQAHAGCPQRDDGTFTIPRALLASGNEHLLAVYAHDYGGASYVDVQLKLAVPTP
jgi:hypothetical protein